MHPSDSGINTELWPLLLEKLRDPLLYPANAGERVYFLYLLTALGFALLVYARRLQKNERLSLTGFLKYCFPAGIYAHRSARLDYWFFPINAFLFKGLVFGVLLAAVFAGADVIGHALYQWLTASFGATPWALNEPDTMIHLLYGLVVILALDFSIFFAHYLQHKVPLLWEFHKVHHSAEVLTPITVYRMHPVDDLLNGILGAVTVGLASGVFFYLCSPEARYLSIGGLHFATFAFYLFAYNLRHSHIPLHYPKKLEHLFISPAQHQIHHSSEVRHFDKNMGFIFGIWDWMFGTLYLSDKKEEEFRLGLYRGEEKEYDSVWKLYVLPFIKAGRLLRRGGAWRRAVTVILLMLLPLAYGFSALADKKQALPSIYLEELTWTEVRDALTDGTTTIIIPTGGTEQNGPHMVLGKHNYIIRHTAGEIARRLGNALVAPVMAYVPEGEVDPPEGHMHFAGTLSLSEDTFEEVLEETAASLKSHGFKTIIFIGDSYNNQAPQAEIAEKLTEDWEDDGVKVLHIGDYYAANGQHDWLQEQGYTGAQIGRHAGIRDTSELMAVHPDGIRSEQRRASSEEEFEKTGVHGDPTLANEAIGKKMLELKIEAALAQIEKKR